MLIHVTNKLFNNLLRHRIARSLFRSTSPVRYEGIARTIDTWHIFPAIHAKNYCISTRSAIYYPRVRANVHNGSAREQRERSQIIAFLPRFRILEEDAFATRRGQSSTPSVLFECAEKPWLISRVFRKWNKFFFFKQLSSRSENKLIAASCKAFERLLFRLNDFYHFMTRQTSAKGKAGKVLYTEQFTWKITVSVYAASYCLYSILFFSLIFRSAKICSYERRE